MFGYIRPLKSQLKICEYDAYRAVYCAFCHSLGKGGFFLRFFLSYDFTFFCLLSLSLSEDFCGYEKRVCPARPYKKCSCVKQNEKLSLAGELAILMLNAKIADSFNDKEKPFLLLWLLKLYLKPKYKKAAKNRPYFAKLFEEYTNEQLQCEKDFVSTDACCHPTAKLLSTVFSSLSSDRVQSEKLSRLGYILGRYIYLTDALDDLQNDLKKGKFNPYIRSQDAEIEVIRQNAVCSINVCIAEASDTLKEIELYNFKPIIENIINLGLENVKDSIVSCKTKKERKMRQNG